MLWIVDRGGPQGTVSKWQYQTFVFDGNAVDLCHHTISPIQTNVSDMQCLRGVTVMRSCDYCSYQAWLLKYSLIRKWPTKLCVRKPYKRPPQFS